MFIITRCVKRCFRLVTIIFFLVIESQSLLAQEVISNFPKHNHVTKDSLILFQAKNVLEATSYRFQISSSISFSVLVIDTLVNSNAVSLDIGSSNQTHFWRAKAYLSNDSTEWSQAYRLTVFSPKNIDNSVLWFSSASVSQANNTPVSTLLDLSGNGYNATQSTTSLQPTFKTLGGFRNLPFIDFNGTDGMQTLVDNSIIRNDSTLSFVSLQLNRNQSYGALYFLGNSGSFNPQYAARTAGSSYNNGAFRFLGYNGTVFTFDLQTPNNIYRIISGQNGLTQSRLFSNGVQVAVSGSSIVPVASGATLRIGCNQDNLDNYNGALHEFVLYKNTIDTSVLRNTERLIDAMYVPKPNLGNNITQINGLCDSTVVLNPGAGYSSYLWSTGATSPTLTVNQFGTYSVLTTDNFGYVFTDKIEFRPNVVFKYPSSTNICLGSGIVWNTQISNYSVVWSDGFVGATRSITAPGSYFYDIVDANLCSVRSDTLLFTIDNYPSTANLGPDTSLCSGNLIALQSGAGETVSYAWPNGSTGNQYAVDTTGNYFVQSVNVNGCVARDTVHINVIGVAPIAAFATANVCEGTNAVFTDNSVPVGAAPIDGWAWDFGDTTSASTQSPTHTYAAPGTYIVELFVQSVGGCGAYAYDTLEVLATPDAAYTFTGHCADQEVEFTDASQAGSAPVTVYAWNFGIPATGSYNFSNIPIPNRIYDDVGTYNVKLVVTDDNGCKDSITQTVQIDPSPVPNFVFESTCQGSPIQFLNTSNTQPSSTYLWDFGDNTSSILINPQHTYPDYGINQVTLAVTNLFDCSTSITKEVEVFAFPLPSLELGAACMDSYVTLENTSQVPLGAIDSTIWVINQTDTLYGLNSAWMVNSLGQQQVQLFTWSEEGCAGQTSQFFDVNQQFNASFSTYPGIIAAGQPFAFENTSNPGSIAVWTFGDGGFSTDFSPIHTYESSWTDSTVEVMLIALNTSGCADTSVQQVLIRRAAIDLEISNLFLQKNDAWYTMGVKLENKGTVDLTEADLLVETPKGLLFNETWNGTLKPTEDSIYVFSAMPTSIFTDQDAIESYVCVSGQAHDLYGTLETYLDNNKVCRNVEGESIVLLPVFPNPIYKDFLVRIYLTNAAEVFLSLDDDRGRAAQTMETGATLQPGYYEYAVDTDKLAEGTYFINLRSGDETKSFKLAVVK